MIDLNNESGLAAGSEGALDEHQLIQLATFALDLLRIHPQSELSLMLVDPDTMASYHERYMGLSGPTDVMSFPMDEMRAPASDEAPPMGLLGDIVLCPQLIAEQAPGNGRTPDEEAQYLLIHGLLHLLGHDHAEPEEKAIMFALNDRIIVEWQADRDA